MESSIATLASYQIRAFFSESGRPTQRECDQEAEDLMGGRPTPTRVQGGSSYTVAAGDHVVQFRAEDAALDLAFLAHVETAYDGFVSWHRDLGTLKNVHVYKMRKVGGVSMYLARDRLYANECRLLRRTLADFARYLTLAPSRLAFFASEWHKTPSALPVSDRPSLHAEYAARLTQLAAGLPQRFRPVLSRLVPRLPALLAVDWPLVPPDVDLLENNIHVDPATGELMGVCDWAGAEYHANHHELRELFYDELYRAMGPGPVSAADRGRVADARLVGLFLTNGWHYEDGTRLPAGEGEPSLCHLDSVLRATCDGYG
ncbi:hypothetical protein VTK73DRAFT_9320 [Phialemonium thermophilum]|uniref:Aminoglycoside phosphotransferase domain-containing protein n=1 Tax=Phialemonium thermophilum TaxID=223376 RepID=A0ABR3W381_9PEZI